MTIKVKSELECSFKKECRIINLRKEYPNYLGIAKWAIASVLSEVELRNKYATLIGSYEPFVYLTADQAMPIVQFHSNNRKHTIRNASLCDAYGYEDDQFEKHHPELVCDPFDGGVDWSSLYDAIEHLAPIQQVRIKKRYFMGYSCVEIAVEENVSTQAVQQSIARSLISLKKYLETVDSDPS